MFKSTNGVCVCMCIKYVISSIDSHIQIIVQVKTYWIFTSIQSKKFKLFTSKDLLLIIF